MELNNARTQMNFLNKQVGISVVTELIYQKLFMGVKVWLFDE